MELSDRCCCLRPTLPVAIGRATLTEGAMVALGNVLNITHGQIVTEAAKSNGKSNLATKSLWFISQLRNLINV